MIDYYLKKHCMLGPDKENPRCKGCIWNDKEINRCIFALDYPKQVTIEEIKERIKKIDEEQQKNLSNPQRRFILDA